MTGRIVGAVLALIIGLLAAVAVPLGLVTAARARTEFREQAVSTAQYLGGIAEERISDKSRDPGLARALRDLAGAGDRAAVYNQAGRRIAGTGRWGLAAGHLPGHVPAAGSFAYPADGRLIVMAPVVPDSGLGSIGTVALSRSTADLNRDITTLWTLIGTVSAAGLLVAAGVAVAIARWVGRPLIQLDSAVRRLGHGDLDTRAPAGAGPAEVRRLAATFNAMAARLQALIHGHRSMMADVSHQVRTPLAALRLRLDLLAQDADAQTAGELAGAQDEIARLARLVNGLLAVARAESGTAPAVGVRVDDIARDRAAAWRPAADERGVSLTVRAPAAVPAQAREGHLEQVLDNLIANALDALEPGGSIRIAATVIAASGQAAVTVADDGRGMSAEQQRQAFRRFASGKPGGTGLGLAIVDRLVEANGGSVALSDTPGGGLTVHDRAAGAPDRIAGTRRPGALTAGPRNLTSSELFLNRFPRIRAGILVMGRARAGTAPAMTARGTEGDTGCQSGTTHERNAASVARPDRRISLGIAGGSGGRIAGPGHGPGSRRAGAAPHRGRRRARPPPARPRPARPRPARPPTARPAGPRTRRPARPASRPAHRLAPPRQAPASPPASAPAAPPVSSGGS